MELALDEAGHVKVQDGKPLYRHSDGKEIPFDAASTVAAITRLNGEAKGHREKHEAATAALKAFEGLDPAAARKALELTANLDAKRLIDAVRSRTWKAIGGAVGGRCHRTGSIPCGRHRHDQRTHRQTPAA